MATSDLDLPRFRKTHRETCHGHCPVCYLLDHIDVLEDDRIRLIGERDKAVLEADASRAALNKLQARMRHISEEPGDPARWIICDGASEESSDDG